MCFFQVLSYSVACSCVSAFSVGIIEAAEAEDAMNKLRTLVEDNQQVKIQSLYVFICLIAFKREVVGISEFSMSLVPISHLF